MNADKWRFDEHCTEDHLMYRPRLIAWIGAILFSALAAASARAATTPVIEAESLGHTPYQSVAAVCINVTKQACTLIFTAVPAGKNLVVANVSCGWSLTHPSAVAAVQLIATTGQTPLHYLPVQFFGSLNKTPPIDNYVFDVQTSAVYSSGQIPEIIITGNGSFTWGGGFCSVTGYLAK
jgi:hypothetical protein